MTTAAQRDFRAYHLRREAAEQALRESERQELLAQMREAVSRFAPLHPAIRRVYVFGSLLAPGRFSLRSDIDLAVDCDQVESETPFWRDLERALRRNVDLRPRLGTVAEAVAAHGELCYARESDPPRG